MREPSATPGPHYPAFVELLRAAESLWNAGRLFLERWELSPSQFNVLNLLQGQTTAWTQVDLSRELIMHRSNITGLVDRLAERGLVERRSVPGDRRVFNVVLTPAGRKLIQEILPHYYEAAEAVWGGLNAEESQVLVAKLTEICAHAGRIAHGEPNRPVSNRNQKGD